MYVYNLIYVIYVYSSDLIKVSHQKRKIIEDFLGTNDQGRTHMKVGRN